MRPLPVPQTPYRRRRSWQTYGNVPSAAAGTRALPRALPPPGQTVAHFGRFPLRPAGAKSAFPRACRPRAPKINSSDACTAANRAARVARWLSCQRKVHVTGAVATAHIGCCLLPAALSINQSIYTIHSNVQRRTALLRPWPTATRGNMAVGLGACLIYYPPRFTFNSGRVAQLVTGTVHQRVDSHRKVFFVVPTGSPDSLPDASFSCLHSCICN
jgi:hypothetical protein